MKSEPAATMKPTFHPFFRPPKPGPSSYVKVPSPSTLEHYLHLDPFVTTSASTSTAIPELQLQIEAGSEFQIVPRPPSNLVKLALCDLDGCLIKTRGNSSWPKNKDDWDWWHPNVKRKLKEWHEDG